MTGQAATVLSDDELREKAAQLLAAAPCSLELPAGAGKTHLLAAAAALAAEADHRVLILTHTNAGVDAIRKRLKAFGVPASMSRVETITSWAFSLAGSYRTISGVEDMEGADTPDWNRSADYVAGARLVAESTAIRDVLQRSFYYVMVDEYQDCTLDQHEMVLALSAAIPNTVILGDRLQAIFGFAGALATWDGHVLPAFPAHIHGPQPHRWVDHNIELGQWLLDVRPSLVHGEHFDFADHDVPGLTWVPAAGPTGLAQVAYGFRDYMETVVLLDKWPSDVAMHASRLGGSYAVMEDIGGRFMHQQLEALPAEGDYRLAAWLARFAKECVIGLAGVDAAVLDRLDNDRPVAHYARPGLQAVLEALDALRQRPTYDQLSVAAACIRGTDGLRIYRWEAWNDALAAITMSDENGRPPTENLVRVRDRLRRTGRRSHNRIASRTLLVKGLEYDHVIIADLHKMTDPRNLYVAMSRARKSITVIGRRSRVILRDEEPR